jgi:hypothetical protein
MSPIEWRPGGKKPSKEGLKLPSNENPEKQAGSTVQPPETQTEPPARTEYTEADLEREKQGYLERARRVSESTSQKLNEIAGEHGAEMHRMLDDLNKKE